MNDLSYLNPIQKSTELLFQKRQREILEFANSEGGRFLLNTKKDLKIIKVTPNAIHYFTGNYIKVITETGKKLWLPEINGEFYCYGRQAKILIPILTKIDLLKEDYPQKLLGRNAIYEAFLHYSNLDLKNSKYPFYLFEQQDFFAEAGDGGASANSVTSWATVRDAATADSTTGTSANEVGNQSEDDAGTFRLTRGFFPIITSSIGAGADIITVIAKVIFGTTRNTTFDDTTRWAITTQASTSSLVAGDYDNITKDSPTEFGTSAAWSGWSTTLYTDVTFNADGRTAVVPTGNTLYGCRSTRDIQNTTPTQRSFIYFQYSETAGTASDPKFDITWLPGVAKGYTFII